ncbi:transferase family-domain-containing protein [Fomes fomentarius]|nr:transferase family-domain-containing protein [Fomes fomentarius]
MSPQDVVLEISRARLRPTLPLQSSARTAPLSILDNSVVRYALTSAVWYFDGPAGGNNGLRAFSRPALIISLQSTLHSYPQWAGQLLWIPHDPANGQRHGRVAVTYGSLEDPGIELIEARCSSTLASLIPDSAARISSGAWFADSFPSHQLLSPTSLALHNTDEYEGRHCVSVQLTTFACGGLSIGLRIVHCIADATAMFQFVKDWGAVHRAVLSHSPLPELNPMFDPTLVDNAAAGDIKGPAPDPTLVSIENTLPMVRYDWWLSADGCPEIMLGATKVPEELKGTDLGPPGDAAPWSTWDVFAPVAHYLLYFSPGEVQRIYEDATRQQQQDSSSGSAAPRFSRLDALVAFVWRLIIRARGMEHDQGLVNLAVTIGVRSRLSPPLPDAFLGSPITLARVSLTGEQIASSLAPAASGIRVALSQFTPDAISALLHQMAYEINPQRIWRAFLGERHSIVTSWQNLDAYGVDFGGGTPPRYVDAVMPSMDGCIHVMEAGPPTVVSSEKTGGSGRWYNEPVCLSVHLKADVMERLLKDPELRKYRHG